MKYIFDVAWFEKVGKQALNLNPDDYEPEPKGGWQNWVLKESLVYVNDWNYKPPFSKNIPVDFRVRLKQHHDRPTADVIKPIESAVKSSKGIGEPPLVLAASVFFAIKHAVMDARREQGGEHDPEYNDKWLEMECPATAQRIRESCNVNIANMKLEEKKSKRF